MLFIRVSTLKNKKNFILWITCLKSVVYRGKICTRVDKCQCFHTLVESVTMLSRYQCKTAFVLHPAPAAMRASAFRGVLLPVHLLFENNNLFN